MVRLIRLIKFILLYFDVLIIKKETLIKLIKQRNHLLERIVIEKIEIQNRKVDLIIFSKDRPMQIDLLIRSIKKLCTGYNEITVLFKYSNSASQKSYDKLMSNYSDILWMSDDNHFQDSLNLILNKTNSNQICFLTDDDVVVDKINFDEVFLENCKSIFSLRLGSNINYSYMESRKIKMPVSSKVINTNENILRKFKWNGDGEWSDPMSLDGHVFNTLLIKILINSIDFKAPNSLEAELKSYANYFVDEYSFSYEKSKLVNIPNNKVQIENNNKSELGDVNKLIVDYLDGYRIDLEKFINMNNNSVHFPVNFSFNKL